MNIINTTVLDCSSVSTRNFVIVQYATIHHNIVKLMQLLHWGKQ